MQRKKPDYRHKAKVLRNTDLMRLERSTRRILNFSTSSSSEFSKALEKRLNAFYNNPYDFDEAVRIAKAQYQTTYRLKSRITEMLTDGDCVFLTFTFTDEYLFNTTSDTRRQAVRRYLTALNCKYVANVDFGAKNGREHYHAVAAVKKVDFAQWTHGSLNAKHIRYNSKDHTEMAPVRLSKYVVKLAQHAVKQTTKRNVLLYSRSDWKS